MREINDLRDWISILEREGQISHVNTEVDWNLELGGIVQEVFDRGNGPALMFNNITGHQDTWCRRLFTASLSNYQRLALMLGMPKETPYKELINIWRQRTKESVKPIMVDSGPVKENIKMGDEVDLLQIPVPYWHKLDGGRYIGTFHGVVTKDPDTGWTNVGIYRMMLHDRNTTGLAIPTGQHIWEHWRKWKKRGQNMPVAIVIGWDPVLPAVACSPSPRGVDEYDIMGALRQEPVELVRCETVDLAVPARAEIVIEGEVPIDFDSFLSEGPFGEYTGYYTSESFKRPIVNVKCVTYRNNPIFQGTMEGVPINEDHFISSINHSAAVWDILDERMTGVTAVNCDPSTAWANLIVQIDNSYYGQVQQVGANVWSSHLSLMIGKNIIVCDTDIDIFDLRKVFWAIAYRVHPPKDIIQYPGWIGMLDPVVHPDDRKFPAVNAGVRMLIDATKPIENRRSDKWWGEKFAPLAYPDDETMAKVRAKWDAYEIRPIK
ncbi:MAG: UbiD family decarboxylase [Thermincola sp.]|jgi:4-hydroxy-3-polyprenylbenzoate decarboxylase|nr:UbiD family decarboxylase [Thermincola sp.]MDT3704133.1 UbiD family decarboxylase [Thermincola sp.]